MGIKGKRNDLFLASHSLGAIEYLLMPLVDTIKISDYDNTHILIIPDSLRRREDGDWFGFSLDIT
jgi:hypothetical protein